MFRPSKGIIANVAFIRSVFKELLSSYLLDKVGESIAAFSFRKLKGDYTGPCIRVRESSLNAEQDIYFSNDILDTAALLSFVGSADGFVVRWYDQSGNASNVEKATATQQPKIVSSGVLEQVGGLPAILFDGVNDNFRGLHTVFSSSTGVCLVSVFKNVAITTARLFDWRRSTDGLPLIDDNVKEGFGMRMRNNSNIIIATPDLTPYDLNRHLGFWNWDGSEMKFTLDGGWREATAALSGTLTLDQLNFVGDGSSGSNHCYLQEMLFFKNSKISEQAVIQDNLNQFWGIY